MYFYGSNEVRWCVFKCLPFPIVEYGVLCNEIQIFTYEEHIRRFSGSDAFITTGKCLQRSDEGWRLDRACRRQDMNSAAEITWFCLRQNLTYSSSSSTCMSPLFDHLDSFSFNCKLETSSMQPLTVSESSRHYPAVLSHPLAFSDIFRSSHLGAERKNFWDCSEPLTLTDLWIITKKYNIFSSLLQRLNPAPQLDQQITYI